MEPAAPQHTAERSPQTLYLPGSGLCTPLSLLLWATVFPLALLWLSGSTSLVLLTQPLSGPAPTDPVQNPHPPPEMQSRGVTELAPAFSPRHLS